MPAGELLGSRLRASLLAAELEQQGSTSLILAHTAYPNHIPHTTAHQWNKIAPKMTIFEVFQKISAAARASNFLSKYREKFLAAARGWLLQCFMVAIPMLHDVALLEL